jgi:hypothetical protein
VGNQVDNRVGVTREERGEKKRNFLSCFLSLFSPFQVSFSGLAGGTRSRLIWLAEEISLSSFLFFFF